MMCGDYIKKYVKESDYKKFMRWGKWWDESFSYWAFYDIDLLHTLNDYAKGE